MVKVNGFLHRNISEWGIHIAWDIFFIFICEAKLCHWFCIHFDATFSASLIVPLQHYKCTSLLAKLLDKTWDFKLWYSALNQIYEFSRLHKFYQTDSILALHLRIYRTCLWNFGKESSEIFSNNLKWYQQYDL